MSNSNPSLILLFFFFFSLFLSSSASPLRNLPDGVQIQHDLVVPLKKAAEEDHGGNKSNLVLAKERTSRKDIFHNLERYHGGWNISNPRYVWSVISTAVPFFAAAIVWFLIFVLSLNFICLCYCCCPKKTYGYSILAYALSLIFLILFTLAAIAGCVILYTGQGKLYGTTSETLDYVVNQAQFTAANLRNVSHYFNTSEQVALWTDETVLPKVVQKSIDQIETKISTAAATLTKQTENNSKKIRQGIDGMGLVLIIIAAVMLFLALLGFVSSVLGTRFFVYFLVIVGGILVAGTFILCGAFLFLHNAIGDTCVAMDEWVLNPTAHTALDDILPCVEKAPVLESWIVSKNVTLSLVNVVDVFITDVANGILGPPLYNTSGPLMPVLCNPFESDLTVRQCAAGEVTLENANHVWKNYICEVSSSGNCSTPGRITPNIYTQLAGVVNVTYALYHYGPFLKDLMDCTFVRKTFSDISNNYCPDLRRFTEWIYVGLVVVSVAVMLSLTFWVIFERERRHRSRTKRYYGVHNSR
ncbi:hypothetical protein RIF29_07615 [Crotalaria pallida]|uniref:Transmembrane protein n=1 Tax=Crotalaria pallida TaxID=3830 RepID=A0AAN9PC03_CROPI